MLDQIVGIVKLGHDALRILQGLTRQDDRPNQWKGRLARLRENNIREQLGLLKDAHANLIARLEAIRRPLHTRCDRQKRRDDEEMNELSAKHEHPQR